MLEIKSHITSTNHTHLIQQSSLNLVHVRLQLNNQRKTCTCNQTAPNREDTERLVIKQRPIVKTPSTWEEHDLLWSIQIQGVFHRRHCLKVQLPRHRGVHSSDTSCSCVRNCYTGCTVLPPCRAQTHP